MKCAAFIVYAPATIAGGVYNNHPRALHADIIFYTVSPSGNAAAFMTGAAVARSIKSTFLP